MIHSKFTPTHLLRTFLLVFLVGILSTRLYAQNEVLTNQSIIQLYRAGISKSVIAAKINNSQCNFDLTTNGLVDLKNNGVPDDIVTTMVNKGNAAPAPDQQQSAAAGDNMPQADAAAQDDAAQQATQAPPELPTYEQPPCPTDGYLWQPGYWAFNLRNGFFWVPGVWVAPPNPDLLWTPSYWGYVNGVYLFHRGYWGATVGFYGGINYGYGYAGVGFIGGGWHDGHFRYNTAVVRVNATVIHNTYVDRTVIRNTAVSRTSFNGPGGVTAKPRAEELAAARQPHVQPTSEQLSHQQAAASDKNQFASANGGHPTQTAVATPNKAPANVNGSGRNNSGNPNGQGNRNPGNGNANGQPNANKPANNAAQTPQRGNQQQNQQKQQRQPQQPKNNNNNNKKNKKN